MWAGVNTKEAKKSNFETSPTICESSSTGYALKSSRSNKSSSSRSVRLRDTVLTSGVIESAAVCSRNLYKARSVRFDWVGNTTMTTLRSRNDGIDQSQRAGLNATAANSGLRGEIAVS